jgi:hypothetical protein
MHQALRIVVEGAGRVSGEYLTVAGERYYAIRNVDRMPPFFMSIVSSADHWLFVSSAGGLTAGRTSPESALFPYITADKIQENSGHTGSKTMLRLNMKGHLQVWEPFSREHDGAYNVTRNLYKNLLGNKLCFEEINHDLELSFHHAWTTSDRYGFVRRSELRNLAKQPVAVELLDGLQNVLPAGTPHIVQTNASNLVDAHKWTELDEATGLAVYTLYSGISDRAEPSESLKANTVFCLGLSPETVLLSSRQVYNYRVGGVLTPESYLRGTRAAYLVNTTLKLEPEEVKSWQIVADVERTQSQVVELRQEVGDADCLLESIRQSVSRGSTVLARIMGAADAYQATGEENVSVHHYANVVFNVLRGGIFDNNYNVPARDFVATVRHFNRAVYQRNRQLLDGLPSSICFPELLEAVRKTGDRQLERLCREYLPLRIGRRHGDPSRPWNDFEIRLKDDEGNRRLSFEGNWRDVFQNWEALVFSYPEFIENIIAKFVNASTMDGYNPYRITHEGIDWEVEEPDHPWSNIGYWGDHQIIYLQKLLELSRQFHPTRLGEMLRLPIYSYANVPYRIKPFDALLADPKDTVIYDHALAARIEQRVNAIGADGKLVQDENGEVCQVNLLEKLLVSLLAKLGNFVIDGGVWLNTQRPEWNDANNALVGHGLSVVTLCYLRRYVAFLIELLAQESESFAVSAEVSRWLADTSAALHAVRPLLGGEPIAPIARYESMLKLGTAASNYRQAAYQQGRLSGPVEQSAESVVETLGDALAVIDHSINTNRRKDSLYHAYNLLHLSDDAAEIETLYPMLEGQVAALSAGAIEPEEAAAVTEALFASEVYRPDQQSFMLYPDRKLPGFLEKNRIPPEQLEAIPLIGQLIADGNERVVVRDLDGCFRFNAEFRNVSDLEVALDALIPFYGNEIEAARGRLCTLYEQVFKHKKFTGRSGAMFAFEGLGSVYWHMVAKLLLAVQENFFAASDRGAGNEVQQQLGNLYYRVRQGLGFNKSPDEYGAFPTDPYSHTPRQSGARQPGMTGQVKEELLSRFGELGVRVHNGQVHFQPGLLRAREFVIEPRETAYLDVGGEWRNVAVSANELLFTWCQVPVTYRLGHNCQPSLTVVRDDGVERVSTDLVLPVEESAELFRRSGRIRQLVVTLNADMLFAE